MAKKVEKKEENMKVNSALALLRKKFGNEAAMTFDNVNIAKVDVISSGSLKLDKILGIGGWPRGRVTLIWGDYSSGKSTVSKRWAICGRNTGMSFCTTFQRSIGSTV